VHMSYKSAVTLNFVKLLTKRLDYTVVYSMYYTRYGWCCSVREETQLGTMQ
jgi:hypothetical protein